jgi:hypothetical protein
LVEQHLEDDDDIPWTSPRTAATTGEFADLSELTGLKTFITSFAGHIAAEAAR